MTYTFSLPEMAFIGLVVLLDLAFLAMVATALLERLGHERLQRWMFR